MEYLGFIFGIFGLMAYLQISSLKSRIDDLETQLSKMQGTDYAISRDSLYKMASTCMGKQVKIDQKEDYEDADIVMYGNTKHGSNTILDVDKDWILVHIETPKGNKDKLIRLESIQSITLANDPEQ